jgi:hypothetical protein
MTDEMKNDAMKYLFLPHYILNNFENQFLYEK